MIIKKIEDLESIPEVVIIGGGLSDFNSINFRRI